MKKKYLVIVFFTLVSSMSVLLCSFTKTPNNSKANYTFPYKAAGLTERQAAAHLISRFSFGAKPGMVDEVVKMGLENWFAQQLAGELPDDKVNEMLKGYPSLSMTNEQISLAYIDRARALKYTIDAGYIDKSELSQFNNENLKKFEPQVVRYMADNGLKAPQDLYKELIIQKIIKATYSNNQLQEVLTNFWFNHFNITLGRPDCARFATVYEQQTIRPNITGKFETLLVATAKSPAMLTYLDNSKSVASKEPSKPKKPPLMNAADDGQMADSAMMAVQKPKARNIPGLNENYAREVMELHTLGVDGGYTQSDVTNAAKVLTGWTINPTKQYGGQDIFQFLEKIGPQLLAARGFVQDGDFLFFANRHDKTAKTIMGNVFPPGGGYQEGAGLLHILSHHPSTAKFISTKMAVRFVSDTPPKTLIDKMAKTFTEKDGDISQVLITMVTSPEFWDKSSVREKTKSPFELTISAIRCLDAEITKPYELFTWLTKMGEKIYYYQPPTGFPDRGQYWINTGSLLGRMNFGLALASQRVGGVKLDLLAINNHHEPESPEAALITYAQLMMPERDMTQTIKRLRPLLNDPELANKVNEAANKNAASKTTMDKMTDEENGEMMMTDNMEMQKKAATAKATNGKKNNGTNTKANLAKEASNMLAQVVGVILGSPEFQRR
jgi:uncharacterized protein (DUF1800 family)